MSLSRRSFLSSLSAIPVIGPLLKQAAPEVVKPLEPLRVTHYQNRVIEFHNSYSIQVTADAEVQVGDFVKMSSSGGVIPCSGLETACIGVSTRSVKLKETTPVMTFGRND